MTAKRVVQELMSRLPDDCSLEDILDGLETKLKIEEGLAAIERGEFYTHEEACALFDQWLQE